MIKFDDIQADTYYIIKVKDKRGSASLLSLCIEVNHKLTLKRFKVDEVYKLVNGKIDLTKVWTIRANEIEGGVIEVHPTRITKTKNPEMFV